MWQVKNERAVFISVYRVYSVITENIFIWIFELWYNIQRRQFTVVFLCVLNVGDTVKRRSRRITREYVDWKGIREKTGEVNITKVYIKNLGDFPLNSQRTLHWYFQK
jgi:hypothetical protein